jgi:pimeloyl-ACP methyl ester carboxylesterase
MTQPQPAAGYFRGGLPYNRLGRGPRPLVVFQGLLFENKPLSGLVAGVFLGMYAALGDDFTVYLVSRKPGLPEGYSLGDMGDDYAALIAQEFGAPVDVIGVSTGGSIAQHFAADHPDLLRRLVIHSSAHRLSPAAKRLQLRLGELARERRWRAAHAALLEFMLPHDGVMKYAAGPIVALGTLLGGTLFGAPADPSDLVVTVEAEDRHDFKARLGEIAAPTLVAAGDKDVFYDEQTVRETAAGIPDARLIIYPGMGHPVSGKQFSQDVLAFLLAR